MVNTPTRLCGYGCNCYRSCKGGDGSIVDSCTRNCRSTCYKNVLDPHITLSKCGEKTFKEKVNYPCTEAKLGSQFKCYLKNCKSDTFTKGNAKVYTYIGIALSVLGVMICLFAHVYIFYLYRF